MGKLGALSVRCGKCTLHTHAITVWLVPAKVCGGNAGGLYTDSISSAWLNHTCFIKACSRC